MYFGAALAAARCRRLSGTLQSVVMLPLSATIKDHRVVIGQNQSLCKAMFQPRGFLLSAPHFFTVLSRLSSAFCLLMLCGTGAALAQSNTPSGLELPRFASTRSTPINVRVGPGTKYDVAWVYLKAGVPIEIIQEFDTWRKIQDVDGAEGWIHQNLLSGNRVAYVHLPSETGQLTLRAGPDPDSGARAVLGNGFRVQVKGCDGVACEVTAQSQPEGERVTSYSGYLPQADLWGVFPDEVFD